MRVQEHPGFSGLVSPAQKNRYFPRERRDDWKYVSGSQAIKIWKYFEVAKTLLHAGKTLCDIAIQQCQRRTVYPCVTSDILQYH